MRPPPWLVAALASCVVLETSGAVSAGKVAVSDTGLVPYSVVDFSIPNSLTGRPGDPAAGKLVLIDRKLGNCLSCHNVPIDAPDQGTVGPNLKGVGRQTSAAQLRLRIVNSKLVNPLTIMPAYYRVDGLRRVSKEFVGKPILTAEQVEDLVAYLATLK